MKKFLFAINGKNSGDENEYFANILFSFFKQFQ